MVHAEKLRFAHLSDIHITAPLSEWTRADWVNKRLAAWFNFRVLGRFFRFRHAERVLAQLMRELSDRGVVHVVFSGDATALGFRGEMIRAAELLEVGKRSGLAVPGNHDYCTVPAAASGDFEQIFAPWQEGVRVSASTYPFAQKVGPAWIIGVNTATGNRWPWDAGGAAGPDQRDRLARLLDQLEPGPRILVTHFPVCLASGKCEPRTRGLRDLGPLVEVADKGKVGLWLHGHRHGHYWFEKPGLAPFSVACAGSATQTGLWSYVEYTLEGTKVEAVRRIYSASKHAFVDADSFTVRLRE